MKGNLRISLKSLRQNQMQATLTLLGMSVGVAMVVVVSGLGLGAQNRIEDQIESAGPTQITLRSGNYRPAALDIAGQQDSGGGEPSEGSVSSGFGEDGTAQISTTDEAVAFARDRTKKAITPKVHRTPPTLLGDQHLALLHNQIEDIRNVTATLEGNVSVDETPNVIMRTIRIEGIDSIVPELRSWTLVSGRFPKDSEFSEAAPVMLASQSVIDRIWPNETNPIGKFLTIKGRKVQLVGIVSAKPDGKSSASVPLVSVPLNLAKSLLDRQDYDNITVRTRSVGVTTQVSKTMREKLRELHGLTENTLDDFRIETQSVSAMPGMGSDPRLMRAVHSNVVEFEQESWEEMARSLRRANRTFTLLLGAAAAVSLIVGGIGIMNIMLVSVTSRTREIGLRMALGAREGDVMSQFLLEATVLAVLGGAIGIVFGVLGLSFAHYGMHWATAFSPIMMLIALAMAAGTGLLFGYGPAKRAALLDPVVAVRSE